jgi:DNA-binding winged helix-turn-helix (wHTH) protein
VGEPVSIRFGEFVFDRERRQLTRADLVVHLSPKAFELLGALIDAYPRAVSKPELLERVWPGTFVSDASLTTAVAEIRTALGGTARRSQYIRTVHRFGYAFQINVIDAQDGSQRTVADRVTFWLIAGTHQIPLIEGENIVGRDPRTSVCLDAPSVSRRHARIVVAADCVTVQDLLSKNGTYVGGDRVSPAPRRLLDNDVITFGSVDVKFRVWSPGGRTTETQHA